MLMPESQWNPEKLMLELLEKQILLMNQMLQIKDWWIWGMCMLYDTSYIYFETFQVKKSSKNACNRCFLPGINSKKTQSMYFKY